MVLAVIPLYPPSFTSPQGKPGLVNYHLEKVLMHIVKSEMLINEYK